MNSYISKIDKIISAYVLAVESGDETDLDTLCDRHPEHADGIRDYFAVRANVLHAIGIEDSTAAIQIEGYDILREIGRGAMGVVFEAIQQNLHRQVAIKVLKDGALGSAATKKRFEDEAKLIAQLDHENIVGMIDYGVMSGQPYMVMPLVHGKALHKAVQKGPLPHADVAKLMLQLTSAISAAHDQGIIHRDIKPANILADADLQSCQISDFGLAAWNEQTQRLTQTGDIVGTVGYIAPEVIRGNSKGNTKSDMYSIGATMYALLTGVPPFRAATPAESLLLAMNSDPVPPRSLNSGIPVDLESICLKCMHPTPDRRYATAQDIHDDLQRFIGGRPVVARTVSTWESFLRWTKRNRRLAAAMAAAGLLLFSLLTAISVSLASSYRYSNELSGLNTKLRSANDELELARDDETLAKLKAEEQRDYANQIRNYVANIFKRPGPTEYGKETRVIDAIDDAVAQLDADYPEDSEFKAEMLIIFGNNYSFLSDFLKADVAYSHALNIANKLPEDSVEIKQNTRRSWAGNSILLGGEKLEKAVDVLKDLLPTLEPQTPRYRVACLNLAYASHHLKDPDAERQYIQMAADGMDFDSLNVEENASLLLGHLMSMHSFNDGEARKLYEQYQDRFEDDSVKPIWRILFRLNFGTLLSSKGEFIKADKLLRLSVEEGERELGPNNIYVLNAKSTLGQTLVGLDQAERALPMLESVFEIRRKRFGDQNSKTWRAMRGLADAYMVMGENEKSIRLVQEFIQLAEANGDTSSEGYIRLLQSLGAILNASGRASEALPILEKIDKYCVENYGPDSLNTLINKDNLATALSSTGRTKESVEITKQLVNAMQKTLTTSHPNTRAAMQNLAVRYWAIGQGKQAIEQIDEVIELRKQHDGPESRRTIAAIQEKSNYLVGMGKADDALSDLRALQEILDSNFEPTDTRLLWNQVKIATALRELGKHEEALTLLQYVVEPYSDSKGSDHPESLHIKAAMGNSLVELNRLDQARSIFEDLLQTHNAHSSESAPSVLEAKEQLATVFTRQENYEQAEAMLEDVLKTNIRLNGLTSVVVLRNRLNLAVNFNKQRKFAQADRQFQAIIEGYRKLKYYNFVVTVSLGRSINLIEAKNSELAEQTILEIQSLAESGSFDDIRGQFLLATARYMNSPGPKTATILREEYKAFEKLQSGFLVHEKRRFDADKNRLLDILELESLDDLETWLRRD